MRLFDNLVTSLLKHYMTISDSPRIKFNDMMSMPSSRQTRTYNGMFYRNRVKRKMTNLKKHLQKSAGPQFPDADGQFIASGSGDSTIQLWDVKAIERAYSESETDIAQSSYIQQDPWVKWSQELEDGWITDSDGNLILFVAPWYQVGLYWDPVKFFLAKDANKLNFSDFGYGKKWADYFQFSEA